MLRKYLLILPLFISIIGSYIITGNSKQSMQSFETETEALEALAFLNAMNAYPDMDIKPGSYGHAFEQYHINYENVGSARDEESSFKNIGPNNIGGRTPAIAIDPIDTNIIYLGSAGGGLWKSTTGGIGMDAWQNIPIGFEVLGVGAIAINPYNTNELYIGTGETYSYGTNSMGIATRTERGSYGIGILKSTDGGATWEKSLDWTYQENRGVWEILFNPLDTNIIYTATTEGVFKAIDGGATWNNILDKKMVMDLEMDKTNGEIIYAGVGNLSSTDKGIYKTDDGGDTWNLLTAGLPSYTQDGRITISAYEGNYNKLWAIIGNALSTVGIYYSDNAGVSWTEIDATEIVSYQGWYAKGLLIKNDDPTKILAGGVEVFRSLNGGSSWTQLTTYSGPESIVHPDIHDIIANPLDNDKVYIICDGGLYRSNDFGDSFYSCNDGLVTSQFYIGSISHQTNDVGLGGLQDNFSLRYDGTNYWVAKVGGDGCYNAINFDDDYIQYAASQYLNVIRSTDQGNNFFEYMATGSSNAFLAPYTMAPSDPEILYAGKNGLVKTTNGGDSWNSVGSTNVDGGNPIMAIGIAPSDADIVYFTTAPVSNDADVFMSTDGGVTKTNITDGLPDRYARDIAINKNDADEVFICFAGFGAGHIFRSVNAGVDWTDISTTLPDIPFHTLLIDPHNDSIIYAGSDVTLFITKDKGTTWEAYNEGLPEAAMIFDVEYSPTDSALFIFTHGRGVFAGPAFRNPIDTAIVSIHNPVNAFANIYPSMVTNSLTIELNTNANSETFVQFFDLQGKLIMHYKIYAEQKKNTIDCSSLAAGNYIVKVQQGKNIFSTKIIKL